MNYIAVDTSQDYLSLVCKFNDKIKRVYLPDCGLQHSITLLSEIEKVLSELGMSLSDADFYCAVTGPGSFTGIRIGVASIKGFCCVDNKKALQVTSFDVLAFATNKERVLAVIDARHDNFYVAGFTNGEISFSPKFISLEELNTISEGYILVSSRKIEGLKTNIVDPSIGLERAIAKKFTEAVDFSEIKPFYLRQSQAEEGRK